MNYLISFFEMCYTFSEDNCRQCPFSAKKTGSYDCHQWIIDHAKESKTILQKQASSFCPHCGAENSMDKYNVIIDSYTNKKIYVCESCGKEREFRDAE